MELRREEILDATVAEIQRLGIGATRVADVASALGVSSSLIFYHFTGKEQLLQEAFEHAARRDLDALRRACARDVAALVRFRAVLRLYGPSRKAPGWRLWIDAWGVGMRVPRLRVAVRQLDDEWRRCIAALVAEGVAAGEFACADTDGAAWRITAFPGRRGGAAGRAGRRPQACGHHPLGARAHRPRVGHRPRLAGGARPGERETVRLSGVAAVAGQPGSHMRS